MPRRLLIATFFLLALALAPAAAQAVDSHAPRGARGDWLPTSEWVMSSWLPFDEARLDALLHTNRAELSTWLNDRRSLGQLAARRGFHDRRALAGALAAPRLRTASPAMARTLRSRALDMLTQPHLARHVLFHIFHTPAIPRHAQDIFGMSPRAYRKLRDSGTTPIRIAIAGHRSPRAARDALRSILVRRDDQAVRVGAMSRRQADALLAEQDAGLETYMRTHYRTPAQQVAFACRVH
ncbi:MAG TPA: hypothetical protein VL120_17980 [Solirubrobacteraceae bacterium]|jgi:hypothetical protein|nr:hypothetical protein [Solirubrobacteraceae bacterium]